MISLQSHNEYIKISNQGSIFDFSINGYSFDSIPIYGFVFQDHSFRNTSCRHLDDKSNIVIQDRSESAIMFEKKYEEANSVQKIDIRQGIIEFDFQISNLPSDYCFGYVLPLPSGSLSTIEGDAKFNIINYCRMFERSFRDQQQTSFPIVTAKLKDSLLSVCAPMEYNVQFFSHKQHNVPCLRVSSFTKYSDSLKLNVIVHNSDPVEIYKKSFPCYSRMFERKNVPLKELSRIYGIEINARIQNVSDLHEAKWSLPTQEEENKYITILENCLDSYKKTSILKEKIKRILLVSNLCRGDSKICGLHYGHDIILDISENISDHHKSRTIHHEIFHALDDIEDSLYEGNKITVMSTKSPAERKAEIFSMIMTDVDCRADEEEIKTMKEFILRHNIIKTSLLNNKKKNIIDDSKKDKLDTKKRICILTGYKHSGFKLICSVLNCSSKIKIMYPNLIHCVEYITESSKTNKFVEDLLVDINECPEDIIIFPYWGEVDSIEKIKNIIDAEIIRLIRNPINICSEYTENKQEFSRMMEDWIQFNSEINTYKFGIKYEDFVFDELIIMDLFDFLGANYSNQFLFYGDFEPPEFITSNDKRYLSGKINKDYVEYSQKPEYAIDIGNKYLNFLNNFNYSNCKEL